MKLFGILLSLLSVPSHAATTGTLQLQGVVPANCNVVVTPNGSNLNLDIVNGESNRLIATSNEMCNNLSGYKINVKSTNGGELRNTGNASVKTTYQISYGGQTVTPTTAYQTVKNVTVLNSPANVNSEVRINVTAYPNAIAGTYSDTVTVQIETNL